MIADLFIKTYRNDLPWLWRCLTHARHYALGFRDTVIVSSPDAQDEIKAFGLRPNERLLTESDVGNPYYFQQAVKLGAHTRTNANYICYVDSDCIARRHFRPESFFVCGKPHYLYTPYSALIGSGAPENWKIGVEKTVGHPVEYEFMRRHPAFHPRETLAEMDAWFLSVHGLTAADYMIQRGPELGLSEFNLIGAWAWDHAHDRYQWIDTTNAPYGWPENYVEQFWSHGGPEHPHNACRLNELPQIA